MITHPIAAAGLFENSAIACRAAVPSVHVQRRRRESSRRAPSAGLIPSAAIGLDARFDRMLPSRALRAFVVERHGVDIGFDAGPELFSSMLALQLTARRRAPSSREIDRDLAAAIAGRSVRGRFHFFRDPSGFAADTDCTGVAAAALFEAGHASVRDLLASATAVLASAAPGSRSSGEDADGALHEGVVMVHWEDGMDPGVAPRGRKHDPAAAANALYLLRLAEREGLSDPEDVIGKTTRFVLDHLLSGDYLRGTRHYPSPDAFLYFVSRHCASFPAAARLFAEPVREALRRRDAAPAEPGSAADPGSALNLAMRILAADDVGLDATSNRRRLSLLRRQDGSFDACPLYTLDRLPIFFGSIALTTLFAEHALDVRPIPRAAPETPARIVDEGNLSPRLVSLGIVPPPREIRHPRLVA